MLSSVTQLGIHRMRGTHTHDVSDPQQALLPPERPQAALAAIRLRLNFSSGNAPRCARSDLAVQSARSVGVVFWRALGSTHRSGLVARRDTTRNGCRL